MELNYSDDRFRILVENSPDLILLLDQKGTILFINHTLPGFTVDGVIGTKVFDYLNSVDSLKYKQVLEEVFSTGETRSLEVSSVGPVYWSTRLVPISKNREVDSVLVIATDITQRNLLEKVLRDSEENLRTIMEMVPTGIIITTPEGKTLQVNETACKIAGYESKEEFIKHHVPFHYKNPDDRKRLVNLLDRDCQVRDFEMEVRRKDDTFIWVSVNSIKRTDLDGTILFVSAFQDITERKNAVDRLTESEARYKSLAEASFDAIIIHDKGKLLEVNKSAEKIFGYESSEMLGKTAMDFTAPESREIVMQNIMSNYGGIYEASGLRKDGTTFPVELIGKGVIYNGKEVRMTALRDITERKCLENEIMNSHKLESLSILAGGIAHDFNNLLTGIIGNLSLIDNQVDTTGDICKRIQESEKAAFRALELTHQLLTFSKGGEPIKKTVSLGLLINESACLALRGSNVTCEQSFPEDLWSVDADEGQIGQVINNLIINADQAMPYGGKISISAENFRVAKKDNLLLNEGRYVRIFIEDTGTGIPDEIMSKIFDPYFTTKQKGNGLGLASSYSIVKKHGGHIYVSSKVGVGTTFSIYLPASNKMAVLEDVVPSELPATTDGRVLIMDDEDIIRDVATAILTGFGYEVTTATGGKEAIRLYKEARDRGEPFNAVIMDLTIPGGIGGKEAIKSLLEYDPDARVLVSSGYSNDPIMSDFKKYGFSAVITKPYKATELKTKVYQVISGKN